MAGGEYWLMTHWRHTVSFPCAKQLARSFHHHSNPQFEAWQREIWVTSYFQCVVRSSNLFNWSPHRPGTGLRLWYISRESTFARHALGQVSHDTARSCASQAWLSWKLVSEIDNKGVLIFLNFHAVYMRLRSRLRFTARHSTCMSLNQMKKGVRARKRTH